MMEPMKPMEPMPGMEPMKPMEPMEPMEPKKTTKTGDTSGDDNSGHWWPAGLHNPASSGGQNGLRYAFFPQQKRLAIERDGTVRQYDTGDHAISGVSQQQSGTAGTPRFTSQNGEVDLESLRAVD